MLISAQHWLLGGLREGGGSQHWGVALQREVAPRSFQHSSLSFSRKVAFRQARVRRPMYLFPPFSKALISQGHWRVACLEPLAQQGWKPFSHDWTSRTCLVLAEKPGYAALSALQVHSVLSRPSGNPVCRPACCRGCRPGRHHERVSRPAPQKRVRCTARRAPGEKARRTGTGSSLLCLSATAVPSWSLS